MRNNIGSVVAVVAGFIGSLTFTDLYQAASFLVLILSAIHLTLKIKAARRRIELDDDE